MNNFGFVKVAATSIDMKISNINYNKEEIIKEVLKLAKQKIKILIFSELSLTGYTCGDLFNNATIGDQVLLALTEIKERTKKTDVLFVVGTPLSIEEELFNTAVVFHKGSIKGVVPKQYIPNHNEFYEKRWFASFLNKNTKKIDMLGETVPFGNLIFESKDFNYKLGIEICEDLWSVIPPSSYLALAGCNIIGNLSASNELVGKDEYRKNLIASHSLKCICGYLYSSAGVAESTTDLVFGGNLYIYENGKLLNKNTKYQRFTNTVCTEIDVELLKLERRKNKTFSRSKRNGFSDFVSIQIEHEDLGFNKLMRKVNSEPFKATAREYEEIFNIQCHGLATRLKNSNIKKLVIGVSGGLDSTLALLVCKQTMQILNIDKRNIIAITMPGFGTSDITYNNASRLCENLGIELQVISIKDACLEHFKNIKHDINVKDTTYENVQARERTQILMSIANKEKGLVVGTGDLSELCLGWCTFNGDHMSMYSVNAGVPKTLIRYIIKWYQKNQKNKQLIVVLNDIIDTPISPELIPVKNKNIIQQTENILGPYIIHDFFIYYFLRYGFSKEKILFLYKNAVKSKFDQEQINKYYNIFITRFFNSQFKRNCLPDGPKVGSVNVSPRGDLRMPSDGDNSIWR